MMRRIGLFFLLLFLVVVVSACTRILPDAEEELVLEEVIAPINLSENASVSLPASTSGCMEGYKCISSSIKAFQYENCSFGERKVCSSGCSNNTCNPAPVCTPGFKCHGTYYKGYQLESCDWINQQKCEYGCENAECKPKPNVTEEPAAPSSSSTEPLPMYSQVKEGEEVSLEGNHTLRIYIIEEGRTRLLLNGFKTDWLEEGMTARYSDGTTIVIREILFQAYAGGTRAVSYSVE